MNHETIAPSKFQFQTSGFLGSLLVGLISGGLAGLVGGVLARVAMRVVAVGGGMTPGFSVGGTLGILMITAVMGAAPGFLYAVTMPLWQAPPRRKGRVIGVALALLLAVVFFSINAEGELALIPIWISAGMFGAIAVIYGIIFGAVAERLSPEAPAETIDSVGFLRAAGLLTLIGGLVSGAIELFLAAAFPAASLVGADALRLLEALAGIGTGLAMIAGLAGLLRSGAAGENRFIQIGLGLTLSIATILALGSIFDGPGMIEVHGLVKVMSRLEFNPDLMILLIGLAAAVIVLLAAGIAVLRAGVWSGWRRYSPLTLSLVPLLSIFVLHPDMLPALLDVSVFGRNQMGHWVGSAFGLAWLALGIALRVEAGDSGENG